MIGILDMGMGNLQSVSNAVSILGYDSEVIRSPSDVERFSHLILPGVGAFPAAMLNLEKRNLITPIKAHIHCGKPLLGICLGMQLLAAQGKEQRSTAGLGLIPGKVERLPEDQGLAIPHVGWNNITLRKNHPVFEKVKTGVDFYFVHSYVFTPDNGDCSLATTDYDGQSFTSAVGHGNIVGLQFHPEKSQVNGLRLIENFCGWDGKC